MTELYQSLGKESIEFTTRAEALHWYERYGEAPPTFKRDKSLHRGVTVIISSTRDVGSGAKSERLILLQQDGEKWAHLETHKSFFALAALVGVLVTFFFIIGPL